MQAGVSRAANLDDGRSPDQEPKRRRRRSLRVRNGSETRSAMSTAHPCSEGRDAGLR